MEKVSRNWSKTYSRKFLVEIDELFPNEIALKKTISRKKTRSINHPQPQYPSKRSSTVLLEHLRMFHNNQFRINDETVEIIKTKEVYNHR